MGSKLGWVSLNNDDFLKLFFKLNNYDFLNQAEVGMVNKVHAQQWVCEWDAFWSLIRWWSKDGIVKNGLLGVGSSQKHRRQLDITSLLPNFSRCHGWWKRIPILMPLMFPASLFSVTAHWAKEPACTALISHLPTAPWPITWCPEIPGTLPVK